MNNVIFFSFFSTEKKIEGTRSQGRGLYFFSYVVLHHFTESETTVCIFWSISWVTVRVFYRSADWLLPGKWNMFSVILFPFSLNIRRWKNYQHKKRWDDKMWRTAYFNSATIVSARISLGPFLTLNKRTVFCSGWCKTGSFNGSSIQDAEDALSSFSVSWAFHKGYDIMPQQPAENPFESKATPLCRWLVEGH